MAESTAISGNEKAGLEAGKEVEKPEDTRAPVGLDAGAPAVTAELEDDGWHGDAEGDGKRVIEKSKDTQASLDEPRGGDKLEIQVQEMELDDEAKKLAREAMRDVEESVE